MLLMIGNWKIVFFYPFHPPQYFNEFPAQKLLCGTDKSSAV